MISRIASIALCVFFSAAAATLPAQPHWRTISLEDSRRVAAEPRYSEHLEDLVRSAALQAVEQAGGDGVVAPNEIWLTVIDTRDSHDPRIASYQGNRPVYPASVVKVCYMLAAYDQVYTRRIQMDDALRQDIDDMIIVSNNRATNSVLDRVTNTTFGPELTGEARLSFEHKRQEVNRYLEALGLADLWATNKTFDAGIRLYGRDVQWLGTRKHDNFERSNMMTTDDTARMLYLLWRRAVVDYDAAEEMLAIMERTEDRQGTFFRSIVPEGWTLYSKDGSTGLCRHDAGIFASPDGENAIIIVAFSKTRNVEDQRPRTIERAAEIILEELLPSPGILDAGDEEEKEEGGEEEEE